MKLLIYSFAEGTTPSQKANLAKLLRNRENKGLLRRLGRGKIETREEIAGEIIKLIKRYNGIVDETTSPPESASSSALQTEGSKLNEKLKEIIGKLETAIASIKDRVGRLEDEILVITEKLSNIESFLKGEIPHL